MRSFTLQDIVFVAITIAFFAVAAGAVRLCALVVAPPESDSER